MAEAGAAEDMAVEAGAARVAEGAVARAAAVVMAAPAGLAARAADTAERAAPAADTVGRVAAAREPGILAAITATQTTISRGRLFRNFRVLPRRTSK